MKKSEMLYQLENFLNVPLYPQDRKETAKRLLTFLEELGMKPPCLPEDDCRAITHIYIGGNYYQWEEDLLNDTKVQEYKKRREEAKKDKRPLRERLHDRRIKYNKKD